MVGRLPGENWRFLPKRTISYNNGRKSNTSTLGCYKFPSGDVIQVVEHLSSNHEILSSNTSATKKSFLCDK
jgi:hypothetical protein